jgi:4-hydroxy 2-oxovalerate aldolase
VGYDGYSEELMGEKEQSLFIENDEIFLKVAAGGASIKSLTPSKYKSLPVVSVYSLI